MEKMMINVLSAIVEYCMENSFFNSFLNSDCYLLSLLYSSIASLMKGTILDFVSLFVT